MVADMENENMETEVTLDATSVATPEVLSEEDEALIRKHRRTFIGSYSHTLDSKGRMVMPLAFREMLGEKFCITPSFDFSAIAVYPEIEYARMRESYDRMLKKHRLPELQEYLQNLDALSYRDQECDGQGRVLLPARIRQVVLSEEKDVNITGGGDHVNILPRPAGDDKLQDFINRLPGTLNLIGSLSME